MNQQEHNKRLHRTNFRCTFCAKTRTKAAIKNLLGEPGVRPLQMSYAQKVIVHSKSGARNVGKDCALIEDIIDEIVVGDGSDNTRFILTSSHPGESLEEVLQFAHIVTEGTGEPQLVEL